MKSLIFIFLLIFNTSWGLTFKNGKEIDDTIKNTITSKDNQETFDEIYTISQPGIIYIHRKNFTNNLIEKSDIFKCYKYSLTIPEIEVERIPNGPFSVNNLIEDMGRDLIQRWCFENIHNTEPPDSIEKKDLVIKEYFLDLVNSRFLLKFPLQNDDQIQFEIGRFLPTLLFTYSLIRESFSEDEKSKVDNMLKNIVNRYDYSWNIKELKLNNKGLYFNNYSLLTSIIINDDKLFNQSIKNFFRIMKDNSSDSGLMKNDGMRGECGLSYNFGSLSPIMSIIWNLKLQGIDLTQKKLSHNHTMDEIVFAILDVANNPEKLKQFQIKYGLSDIGSQISCYSWMSDDNLKVYYNREFDIIFPYHASGWVYAYKVLSSNPEINLKLFNQINLFKQNIDLRRGDQNSVGGIPLAIYE